MVIKTAHSETDKDKFGEVNNTDVFIAHINTDYAKLLSVLDKNGLRAPTYQELIPKLLQNSTLKAQLEGKLVYLSGKCPAISKSGECILDKDGELISGSGERDTTVYVFLGNQPLLLYTHKREDTKYSKSYLSLFAFHSPYTIVDIAIGVKKTQKTVTHYKNTIRI